MAGNENLGRFALVELHCRTCNRRWHRRTSAGEHADPIVVASSEEVNHHLADNCKGSVEARLLSLVSEALNQRLRRCEAGTRRFDDFCLEEGGSISVLSALLDVPLDKAAAVAWAERELETDREMAGSLPEIVVGLGSTLVRACESANISVQPELIFRPERLEVPEEVARHFFITDVKVGKNSQLASPRAIPASVFCDRRHRHLKLRMDVALRSMFCTVSVTSAMNCALNFTGALVGHAIEWRMEK